ncbi:MAG: hypothetical protein ABI220_00755 [Candidatus Saccharimonadales bacterium]
MDPSIEINERVDVAAYYYAKGEFMSLVRPIKMRWRSQDITFTEQGLRHPTIQGKRMIHVFHVSDGTNNYRLEFDAENLTWTLVKVIAGNYEMSSR